MKATSLSNIKDSPTGSLNHSVRPLLAISAASCLLKRIPYDPYARRTVSPAVAVFTEFRALVSTTRPSYNAQAERAWNEFPRNGEIMHSPIGSVVGTLVRCVVGYPDICLLTTQ